MVLEANLVPSFSVRGEFMVLVVQFCVLEDNLWRQRRIWCHLVVLVANLVS